MAASRFPGKPLAEIFGMPMLGHCYHRTALALGYDMTFVATCDEEICRYMEAIKGASIMTSKSHQRATERTAEALGIIEASHGNVDLVVMVQGDEPLIAPTVIRETIDHFQDETVSVVNVMSPILVDDAFLNKNNVKVVVDKNNDALYFSRESIPSPWKGFNQSRFMQTGVIAFRSEVLKQFLALSESKLEMSESVDMNRLLENGIKIRMVATKTPTLGVDTKKELEAAAVLMRDDVSRLAYMKS